MIERTSNDFDTEIEVVNYDTLETVLWYQEENEVYFEYFSSWTELQEKYNDYCCSPDKVILKRNAIINSIKKSNVASLEKWKAIISQ